MKSFEEKKIIRLTCKTSFSSLCNSPWLLTKGLGQNALGLGQNTEHITLSDYLIVNGSCGWEM